MSTLGSILNIARGAIHVHQTAIRVASQNISNAQTEGYSRQRVRLVDAQPDITPLGRLGTGVRIFDITRVRDTLLDASFRREAGRAESFATRYDLLDGIQEILGEPSETGLAAALDSYFSAWGELSAQPTNESARRLVLQHAEQVASTLRGFSGRLDERVQSTRNRLEITVTEVNRLSQQIASVNELIVREEATGLTASDLRDQRDRLVDSMAQLGSVRVIERGNGTIAVRLENALVVDGPESKMLEASGEPPVVTLGSMRLAFGPEGSVLGELVRALTVEIPGVQQRLDELASGMVTQTNALHRAGFLPDGTTGHDFFDPAGTSARDIAVVVDLSTLVIGDDPAQPENNRIALAMAAMRGRADQNEIARSIWSAAEAALFGGASIGEQYRTTIADLAVQTRIAEDGQTVFSTLASQLEMRRQSVSGVSTDEELIRVMEHQHAYTAAARLVTVVDEMLQTVLDMKR